MSTTVQRPASNICIDLGLIDYAKAYEIQKQAVAEVIAGGPERFFICEHPAVLTLGRMADEEFILMPKEQLAKRGIKTLNIDRGGEVTLHAPGQLVVYPILDLNKRGRDLHAYIRKLESVGIDFIRSYGVDAQRNPGKTGVWAKGKKAISIGVGVKKWVTFHGMAVNVTTDLKLFTVIKPCGLDVSMASVSTLVGKTVELQYAREMLAQTFKKHFFA